MFERRWRARWIWHGAPPITLGEAGWPALVPDAGERWVLFRRRVVLDEVPRTAPLRATADSRYVLWVNGLELMRGPVRGNPRLLHYDAADAAPRLRPGENVVAALVRHYGQATPWWMPARPSYTLGGGAFVCELHLGEDVVGTDSDWRALAPEAWRPGRRGGFGNGVPEVHDARAVPVGWLEPGFDDADWFAATELEALHPGATGRHSPPSDPYGPLLPRPIPLLGGGRKRGRPVALAVTEAAGAEDDPVAQVGMDERAAVPAGTPDAFPLRLHAGDVVTVDFGEVVAGTATLELDAPAGTRVDVSCAEGLYPDGRLRLLNQNTGFRYTARGEEDRFETFEPVGLRFAKLSVRGGPAVIRSFDVRERLFPRPPGASFRSSDPVLDRIWEVGLRTVDLCAQDAYLDCPTREQRAWTADAAAQQQVHLATSPDWSLARRNVELCASPRPDGMLPMAAAGDIEHRDWSFIPDWALHWVRAVHNLWRYEGDRDFVARMLSVAEGVLRWFERWLDDGLLRDVGGWVLIDWASVPTEDTSSSLNALWARGLRDFAEMAGWLGDGGRADWARRRHADVARAFDRFWDPDREVYVDHLVDGERRPPVSQHAAASALAAGLVPPDRIDACLRVLTDRSRLVRRSWFMQAVVAEDHATTGRLIRGAPEPDWDVHQEVLAAEPFFRYVVHDALAACGRADAIADLCRDWKVFLDAGETTWPETWHGGTHCHGWCATPTRDLIAYTLGIRPAEPGFTRVLVDPALGDLEWAEGTAPTPYGWVRVRATREEIEIESPVAVEVAGRRLDAGRHVVRR